MIRKITTIVLILSFVAWAAILYFDPANAISLKVTLLLTMVVALLWRIDERENK